MESTRDRYRKLGFRTLVLALAALLWAAPAGLRQFSFTSLPTQIYYCILAAGGLALLGGGGRLLLARKLGSTAFLAGCGVAAALAVNQVTGLAFNTILCVSAG